MRDTLGLDDADDRRDLRFALENSFKIQFSEDEAAECKTVDNILQVIRNRLLSSRDENERCVTAMAFYRLRRAISGAGIKSTLTPDTCLKTLTGLSARRLLKEIGRRSELQLPVCRATLVGQVGGWTVLAGLTGLLLAAIAAPHLWFAGAAAGFLGFVLTRVDPGRLPSDCQTLGSLARKVAGMNFGTLHGQGAKLRDRDIWNALVEVLSEHSVLPKTSIRPEVLISRNQRSRS